MNTMLVFTDTCPKTGRKVSRDECYNCPFFVATSLPGCIKCRKNKDDEEAK
jgi:hypothetical protein